MKSKTKIFFSWALTLCMMLSLMPVVALAAAPEAPTGLKFAVGGNFPQTLPVLTWNKVAGATGYNVVTEDEWGNERMSGGTLETHFTLDSYGSNSIKKCLVSSKSSEGESIATELSCDLEITFHESSTFKSAIHSSAQLGGDTYQLYTFTDLPANTSVRFEYGALNENDHYVPIMSNPFETNSDGVLVISDKANEDDIHYPNGVFHLGDGAVGANDRYYITTYTDTLVNGTQASFTERQYPVEFDFDATTTDTQTLTFQNPSTQSLTRGNTLTNTASTNKLDGGSILYFANSGNCIVNPNTGKVTPVEPFYTTDDFAYIYAYAGAVEGKYPAAIARYGVNITWTALGAQDLSWNDSDENLNAIYGDTVTGHTAVNNTSGGGDLTYSSTNTNVATVDSDTGEVTISGAGTTTIAATAAEVEGEYNSSSISYTLTVEKKDITVSAVNETKAYGEANPAFTFTNDPADLVSGDDTDDLAVTLITTATNASSVGDYDITGTSTSAKYNVTVVPGTLSITKASAPTVSDITKNLLYSEAYTDVVVNITGLPSGSGDTDFSTGTVTGDTAIINGAVSSTDTGIQFSTNIGTTNQTATIPVTVTMENYEDTTVNVIVTLVDKTPVTITGVTVSDKTYDGVAASYEGTPSNEDGYDGEYEYVWSSGSAPKDAGDYTLIVKIPNDNETYMGELVIHFNIAKKALTVKPNNISIKKGASLPSTFALDYVGLISGDTTAPSGTPEFVLKNGADALANSNQTGTYTIEWTNKDAVTIEHPNYDITKADGIITIKKKSSSDDSTSSAGGSTTPATTKNDASNPSVDAQTKTTNGAATASVSGDAVKNAIKAAEKAAGENKVEIKAAVPSGAKEIAFSVPRDSLQNFAESKAKTLSLVSEIGEITINTETAASIAKQAGSGNVNMSIAPVEKGQLNEEQRGAVGDAPIYDISVSTQGNKISSFDGGTITISLPYELKEGEDPSNVVVWYLDSKGDIQKVESAYDKTTGKVVFTTNHLSLYVVGYEAKAWKNPFADIAENAWYFDAVQFANEQGLMSGTSATKFAPELTTTRGMLVAILYRMENSPSARAASFTDVSANAWYANAVEWAVENKIASGYSGGQFGPEDTITREQMAVILMNYAKLKGYDTNTDGNGLSAFADQSKVSPWAFEAMEWAVSQGLIAGKTTTNLDPNGSATRSQLAAILMRLSKHQEM